MEYSVRISLAFVTCLAISACADGWTNMRFFPKADGADDADAIYHTGINGQGIVVHTWISDGYESRAMRSGPKNVSDPKPLLIEAAQRVAKLNCPAGYRLINETAPSDFSYTMRYVCGA